MKWSYLRHLGSQWPVIRAMGAAAMSRSKGKDAQEPDTPGPWFEATLPPRDPRLLQDIVAWSGGDPAVYRGITPAYLFPQWSFPQVTQAMQTLPYPLTRILNAGCLLRMNAPLPADQPLRCRTRLSQIEQTAKGKLFTVEIETGTAEHPQALYAALHTFLPAPKADKRDKHKTPEKSEPEAEKKEQPRVPLDAREIQFLDIKADAGTNFALLTGDVNPIHWLPLYAKMAGFSRCILHGFGTLALTYEALHRNLLSGKTDALREIEVRFRKPITLPKRVGIYTNNTNEIFVGDAPGGTVYLQGRFVLHSPPQTHPS